MPMLTRINGQDVESDFLGLAWVQLADVPRNRAGGEFMPATVRRAHQLETVRDLVVERDIGSSGRARVGYLESVSGRPAKVPKRRPRCGQVESRNNDLERAVRVRPQIAVRRCGHVDLLSPACLGVADQG